MRDTDGHGYFLVIEGVDGTGKSTAACNVAEALADRGDDVVRVRDPGGTEAADALRDMVLSGATRPFGPEAGALAYSLAYADLLERVVRPALGAGRTVVADRFWLSTLVYQPLAGADPDTVRRYAAVAAGGVVPDLTVLLDAPERVCAARLSDRRVLDHWEAAALDTVRARREAYLRTLPEVGGPTVVVDATLPPEEVAGAVIAAMDAAPSPSADPGRPSPAP